MSRFNHQSVSGFLKAEGRKMVNGKGEEVILRGWGAGNWTNPEGFMVGGPGRIAGVSVEYALPGRFDRRRSMDSVIRELCGSKYADSFWPRWYRNHLGEKDIAEMAALGYNSVRLPLSAAAFLYEEPGYLFNEDSFQMLDSVLDYCEKYGIYAVIDMHGAVGGQSALACDDGIDSLPHMFLDEESWERTIVLWEEIARRYKDRYIVGGYDLLNEPLSPVKWHYLFPKLREFYDELIPRIRAIDKNHLLTIEGGAFSTDNSIFFGAPIDPCNNWCIHIHQYGFSPEIRDLQRYLERSVTLDVPIWIGEGGSSLEHMAIYYDICASEHIGFNLWCWKTAKEESRPMNRGGLQYRLPKDWELVRTFCAGGPKPGFAKSIAIFDELLENIKFEHCEYNRSAHDYIQRRPSLTLPAVGYDHKPGNGKSFSGNWEFGNPYNYRTEDHTKLVLRPGFYGPDIGPAQMMAASQGAGRPIPPDPAAALLVELNPGDFACYTIREVKTGCKLSIELFSPKDATLLVSCGETEEEIALSGKEEAQTIDALTLPEGEELVIKIASKAGILRLSALTFTA